MKSKFRLSAAFLIVACAYGNHLYAQTAGADADYNKKERQRAQEDERIRRADPPIKEDPIGNALIGGGVTAVLKGTGAGAVSAVRGAGIGSTVQSAKDGMEKNKAENHKAGRGSDKDPRYNPGTLFDR